MPEKEYQLRKPFGPPKGKHWWSSDYDNIELRIWAYSCGNVELIQAFEQGESVHLVIARELHGNISKSDDRYKYTKNGNFSLIYGATPHKADATYRKKGAYKKLIRRFPEIQEFSYQKSAECARNQKETGRYGLYTLGGYFLFVPMHEPHKAVNFFVQGSAGIIMNLAMIGWDSYVQRNQLPINPCLQIHDDLTDEVSSDISLEYLNKKMEIMERQGTKLGVPTPVSSEIITESWAEGKPYIAA